MKIWSYKLLGPSLSSPSCYRDRLYICYNWNHLSKLSDSSRCFFWHSKMYTLDPRYNSWNKKMEFISHTRIDRMDVKDGTGIMHTAFRNCIWITAQTRHFGFVAMYILQAAGEKFERRRWFYSRKVTLNYQRDSVEPVIGLLLFFPSTSKLKPSRK